MHQGCGLPNAEHLPAAAVATPSTADSAPVNAPNWSPVKCQATGDLTFAKVSESVRVPLGGITVPS